MYAGDASLCFCPAQLSARNMMVDSTWASAADSYIDIYNSLANPS